MSTPTLQLSYLRGLALASVKKRTLQGRAFLVFPITALVEGVTNGALSLMSEFAKLPAAWNGRPMIVVKKGEKGHGFDANEPSVIEERAVGFIFNARLDDDRIKVEGWLDIERAKAVGEAGLEVLRRLVSKDDEEIEVSVGFWTTPEQKTGSFKGEAFGEIERDIQPNHIALLPFSIGACSFDNGCGVRDKADREGGDMDEKKLAELIGQIPEAIKKGFAKLKAKGRDAMTKDERIAALIASEANSFTKEDREKIAALDEATLEALTPCACKGNEKAEAEAKAKKEKAEAEAKIKADAEKGKAGDKGEGTDQGARIVALEKKLESLDTANKVKDAALAGMLAEDAEKRKAMIDGLLEKVKLSVPRASLEAMTTAELENLTEKVGARCYVGAGGSTTTPGEGSNVGSDGKRRIPMKAGFGRMDSDDREAAKAKEGSK